ncbi:HAMP domain-containing histidine kinase [Planomonospora sp. ID67723]|uniref:sensor histidine kinase n=1 Tax=Planomonospora sp. ID67723 TaxID=2738134 RepID=UPI0018C402A6|nr:HAMP domain-containing sensor histidine kinase [Planomonospora sp. ID67723]MBG0829738.1 HAMP domain-containing histidine kinase [Planomonospora sp. ID67723]
MMTRLGPVLGEGVRSTARQAGLLFAVAGALAAAGMVLPSQNSLLLGTVAVVDLITAAAAWWLPWQRFGSHGPLVLCVPALALLATATWAFEGVATSIAPFFMLLFAWVGLHFSPRAVLALAVPAAVSYLGPLIAADRGPVAISGGVIFIPIMVTVGVLIARQVEHQRRAHSQVERMERWRAALSATLAHDVRSPLTSAQFAVEILAEEGPDLPSPQRDQIASMALRQIDRIRRLSASLLDAERLDVHGGLRLDVETVDLLRAVREAVGYVSDPVAVEVPDGLRVRADPERLEQILINLVANAVSHGALPVAVSAEPVADGMVAVHVRDHGPGVAKDKEQVLFSRFSGADANPESVGLGLWITRELARAHGGDVGYAPAAPGSCFTITLPAAPPPTEAGTAASTRPSGRVVR